MLAVKNILSSASGKTVLPMSLPSATSPPDSPIFLCSSTRYCLISFIEEILETIELISGERISSVTQ